MKTIKLVGMAHQFGATVQTNEAVEGKYRLSPGFILDKTGVLQRYHWDKLQNDPAGLAYAHAAILIAQITGKKLKPEDAKAVFGSSNPYGETSIPSPTHQFAHWCMMKDKMVAHINYGCGGQFATIELMHHWLMAQEEGTKAWLVLTDWPSSMVNNYQTEALFSDALHVSLWSNTDGDPGFVVERSFSAMAEGDITSLSVKNGNWEMDGSAVSRFVRTVPKMVADRMGITLRDFDIIPHQPNVRLLETLERDYGVPFYKEVVREHGNPTCSGTMIALEKFLQETNSTKPILAMGFGDSLSYGAMIVRR